MICALTGGISQQQAIDVVRGQSVVLVTLIRNKADKECEINAKLEGQRDDLIEQINQTNHKNEKILANIKDLEYGIGAKEEKIIAAKDEEMNARIKKQEITSKIESEIRMLNDEVTRIDFQSGALSKLSYQPD